jgi:hypothetical protein
MKYHPVMATKDEMRQWFYDHYETAVGAWFYDTKLNDLQRIAAPVDVRQALTEHFPESSPEEIEELAKNLDTEGSWIDPSSEKPIGTEPADPLLS